MRANVQTEAIARLEVVLDLVQPCRIKSARQEEIQGSVDAALIRLRLVRRLRAPPALALLAGSCAGRTSPGGRVLGREEAAGAGGCSCGLMPADCSCWRV
jgi:hypothetical protein